MQFVDEASFTVRAGRGGDGSVSFNREKYKPRGGPDGGRGGDGGDVVLVSTEDLSTLEPHAYRNVVKAGRGGHGSSNNKAGERGKDAVLDVPVGTQVFDADGLLADLSKPGESFVVAGGGVGGRGNGSFATSTRQAPAFRERGLPGEERGIRLELKVLSDVGLVGLPNAGKSSLLRTLSAARPRVGDYPFTTLSPQLGVVDERTYRERFVVADIPGLISGASEGRGLGNRFLRHVARARLLALVLDASEDPEGAEGTLRAELHAARLSEKPTVVVLNKVDLLDEELRAYLREVFPGCPSGLRDHGGRRPSASRHFRGEAARVGGGATRARGCGARAPHLQANLEGGQGGARERRLRRLRRGRRAARPQDGLGQQGGSGALPARAAEDRGTRSLAAGRRGAGR